MAININNELDVYFHNGHIVLQTAEDCDEIHLTEQECVELISFIFKKKERLKDTFNLDSGLDANKDIIAKETCLSQSKEENSMFTVDSLNVSIAKEADSDLELRARENGGDGYYRYLTAEDGLELARHLICSFGIHPTSLFSAPAINSDSGENSVPSRKIQSTYEPRVFEVERIFNG